MRLGGSHANEEESGEMSVAAFPWEKMQMCFLSPPAATFIPADQWVTGERERVCLSARTCGSSSPRDSVIRSANGSRRRRHRPPGILSKVPPFTNHQHLRRKRRRRRGNEKKKISSERQIAEHAPQQAYKSFFNQSTLRARLHTQTPH